MKKFDRLKIDTNTFSPKSKAKEYIKKRYNLKRGFNLLYLSKGSPDKELHFVLQIFERLLSFDSHWNLLIISNGASLNEVKDKIRTNKRLRLAKKVDQNILPYIYSGSDLLIFPKSTKALVRSVGEAQACGLPAIVSNKGTAKKLIEDHRTGMIARAGSEDSFVEKILFMRKIWETNPHRYAQMKKEARRLFLITNSSRNKPGAI